jgi:hypothetical protein
LAQIGRRTALNYSKFRLRAGGSGEVSSVEEVGLFSRDNIPQGLVLKPTYPVIPDLLQGDQGAFISNFDGLSSCFGEQLRLAAAFHRDEEPGGFVNRMPDRQKTMILENDSFAVAQGFRDTIAF